MKHCLDCNGGYGDTIFLWVTDEIWNKIGCQPSDYLCSNCIIKRINKTFEMTYGHLVIGNGEHEIKRTGTKISIKDHFNKHI